MSGEVDLATAEKLEEHLHGELEADHLRLMTDLREVGFMDSSGLGVLLRTFKKARELEGDMIVVCSDGPVRRILTASGFDQRVRVQEDTSLPRP